MRDGFETTTIKHTFEAPWYQVPPLDFFSENLTVREIRDERILDFTMVPQQMVPSEQLWQNAENLRQNAQRGYVAPLPNGGGTPVGPAMPFAPPPALNAPQTSDSEAPYRGPWR